MINFQVLPHTFCNIHRHARGAPWRSRSCGNTWPHVPHSDGFMIQFLHWCSIKLYDYILVPSISKQNFLLFSGQFLQDLRGTSQECRAHGKLGGTTGWLVAKIGPENNHRRFLSICRMTFNWESRYSRIPFGFYEKIREQQMLRNLRKSHTIFLDS